MKFIQFFKKNQCNTNKKIKSGERLFRSALLSLIGVLTLSFTVACSTSTGTVTKFQFPEFETQVLDNGVTLYFVKDASLPYFTLQAAFDIGSSLDPTNKEGSAVLMFEMLKEGSLQNKGSKLKEAYSNFGTALSVNVERDFASLRTKSLSKYSDEMVSLFVETITSPEFGKREFERRKSVHLADVQRYMETPSVFVSMLFYYNLFGGTHAYGMPVTGTISSVKKLSVDDIKKFYKSYMQPSRMHIAISGLYTDSAKKILIEKLGALKADSAAALPRKNFAAQSPAPTKIIFVDKPDMAQAEVRIGYQSLKRNHPDFVKFHTANAVISGGDFSSRLMQEARVKRGLVYGIYGAPQGLKQEGPLVISASTRHEKIPELIQVVLQQFESARLDGITAKELKDQKATILGQLPRSFETTESYIARVMQYKLYGFDENYLNTYINEVAGLSNKEANELLAKYYRNTNLQITILGSKKELNNELDSLGIPVEFKDYKSPGF